jgi:hypothetical protein
MRVKIQDRAGANGDDVSPFKLKPVPAKPTHCRSCGLLLEAMRRYAGLCKKCVAEWPRLCVLAPPAAEPRMQTVRHFMRRGTKWVELECACGTKREMQLSTYEAQRPQSCKPCRLRALKRRGFEAEYARWRPPSDR